MRPTPINVLAVTSTMLVVYGVICAWLVHRDELRQFTRDVDRKCTELVVEIMVDCSAFLEGMERVAEACRRVAPSFQRMAENIAAMGEAWARALPNAVQFSNAMVGRGYEPSGRVVLSRGVGSVCDPSVGSVWLDAGSFDLGVAGWPEYTQRPEDNWDDAHRVAALADRELAAWDDFIRECGK